MRDRPASPRSFLFPCSLLALAILAAYLGSFSGPFVLDDAGSIAANPTIRHLWPVGPVLTPPGDGRTVSGRPVLNLSFAINYALGGMAVGGYHAVNLAIHLAAALTLFGIVRRTLLQPILRERYGADASMLALAAAAIWAVHPLQTESVTYVAQRAESLLGLFYLLTVYCFVRAQSSLAERELRPGEFSFARSAEGKFGQTKRGRVPLRSGSRQAFGLWGALSFFACLCGMATKEVMVSAPVMVFLYDRTFVAGTFREAWRRHWRLHLSLASTWVLLAFLVVSNGSRGGTSGFGVGVPWWTYELTQFGAVWRYLQLAAWPHPLIFDYGTEWVRDLWAVLPAAVLVTGLLVGTGYALLRSPIESGRFGAKALGFAGAFFLAIMAPTSLVPGNRQTLAEHRMYLALAPVVLLAVGGIYELMGRSRRAAAIYLFVVAGLGALTVRRNEDYRSALALWSDTVAKRPLNPYAQNNLGHELLPLGKTEEAIGRFEEAVRLNPDLAEPHAYLGGVLVSVGRLSEAMVQCREAVRLNPNLPSAHSNWGFALSMSQRLPEAILQYQEALRLDPDFAEAHFNLSTALAQVGRVPEAIDQCEQALRLRADFPEARAYLERLRSPPTPR